MKHKNKRHTAILSLIKESDIETQTDLALKLRLNGINATQATISRDIKQLHLIKVLVKETNKYRYEQRVSNQSETPPSVKSKAMTMLRESIVSMKRAQNLVVVKCYTGTAPAACTAIDSASHNDIVGTIAGDDTIFIATENNERAEALIKKLSDYISEK